MAKKDSNPESDERNIVGAEQVNVQDLEDQLYMIWEKNKGLILGGVGFVFAVFFGFQGMQYFEKSAVSGQQERYQAADTPSEKLAFAEDDSGEPLAGLAAKELADDAYAEGNFAQAEALYRDAATSTIAPLKDAATLGMAIAQQAQGNLSDAKTTLESLANSETAANAAEAQYRLALIAKEEGDLETARSLIEAIPDEAQFWKARARSLEQELPSEDA